MYQYKHGLCDSRIYRTWKSMKNRCDCMSHSSYWSYGGRGIKYCKEWKEFIPFLEWSFENGYSDTLTLDRIDVNGNYCPENCRWVGWKEQGRNKRGTLKYNYLGESLTCGEISERTGIKYSVIYSRIKRGYTVEQAINLKKYAHKNQILKQKDEKKLLKSKKNARHIQKSMLNWLGNVNKRRLKMKTILTIIVLLLLTLCGWYLKVEGDQAFKDCMDAGKQSRETCEYYAYM